MAVNKCIKYLLFFFNLLFWVSGCIILGVSIYLKVSKDGNQITSKALPGIDLMIAIGVIIMVLGFLGCCGAIRENRCMLLLFFISLLIIFILLLAAGIVGAVDENKGEGLGEGAFTEVHPAVITEAGGDRRPGETAARAEVLRSAERPVRLGEDSRLVPLQRDGHRVQLVQVQHRALRHQGHQSAGGQHEGGSGNRLRHRHPADLRHGVLDDPVLSDRQEAGRRHHQHQHQRLSTAHQTGPNDPPRPLSAAADEPAALWRSCWCLGRLPDTVTLYGGSAVTNVQTLTSVHSVASRNNV